jgi:UPF0271 protein
VKIDLNCDVGEGYGNDAELLSIVTSANIACGYHAGDADTMKKTVDLAIENGSGIGAHPGYRDREGFGRQVKDIFVTEIFEIITDQVEALQRITRAAGSRLQHVKPHGALYNQAAKDPLLAESIAAAVKAVDKDLILFGLSGSALIEAGSRAGLRTAAEIFADRTYTSDGSLTPRSKPNALISDADEAVSQVMQIIQNDCVTAVDGTTVKLNADTICIHGDGENAVAFAFAIRNSLAKNNVEIVSIRQLIE